MHVGWMVVLLVMCMEGLEISLQITLVLISVVFAIILHDKNVKSLTEV